MEKLAVENISCEGCANTIKKGLSTIEGLENLSVDIKEGSISYEATNKLDKEALKKRLSLIGYPVKS